MSLKIRYADGTVGEIADPGAALEIYRHSTSHLMAAAVNSLFPGTHLGIGPAISDGFYYDFERPEGFAEEDLAEDRSQDEGAGRSGSELRAFHRFERRSDRVFHAAGGAPQSRADSGKGRRNAFLLPAGRSGRFLHWARMSVPPARSIPTAFMSSASPVPTGEGTSIASSCSGSTARHS